MIHDSMKKIFFQSLFFCTLIITISYAEIVKELKVIGNNRISAETIVVFGDVKFNEDYDTQKIDELIKKLYDTNILS